MAVVFRHAGPAPLPPLFSLRRLNIGISAQYFSSSVWSTFFQPSIVDLQMGGNLLDPNLYNPHPFSSVAPNLRSLQLSSIPPPSAKHMLASCPSLSQLTIIVLGNEPSATLVSLFDYFPINTIRTLTIGILIPTWLIDSIVRGLLDSTSLQSLSLLSIVSQFTRASFLKEDGAEGLLKQWEKRGVEINFRVW